MVLDPATPAEASLQLFECSLRLWRHVGRQAAERGQPLRQSPASSALGAIQDQSQILVAQ